MIKIYKIIYNSEVIYIGQTKQILKRRKNSGYPHIPKEIIENSFLELIEETDDISRENYWIDYYRKEGCILYNKNKGLLKLTTKTYYNTFRDDLLKYKKDYYNVLELYRDKYYSMFLTNFRNSTSSYARKRISFDVVYRLISYILKEKNLI